MGRPAHFAEADLIRGATRVAAKLGPAHATIALIARETEAPVGSLYHRYPSRSALLAEVWLSAAERFQAAFLKLMIKARTADEAVECALFTPRFARDDHAAAVVLIVHRRDDFLQADISEHHRDRAAKLATDLRVATAAAAARLLPSDPRRREKIALGLVGIPLGAVRIYLPQAVPPAEIDPVIAAAVRAALNAKPA